MRILIVEDNTDSTFALRHLFRDMPGVDVRAAHTLADADAAVGEWAPDLLLVDLQLPDGDGLDFLRRAKAVRPAIRAIVCTGSAGHEVEERARECGAEAVLFKPLDARTVLEAVGLPAA